jgi:hypothetical protein
MTCLYGKIYKPTFEHGNVGTRMTMSCRKAEIWKIEEGRRHYDTDDELRMKVV